MKFEDAVYYECLLSLGETTEYDEWLNDLLENESPLSEIVLELSYCGSDYDKAISLLHNFALDQQFDKEAICDRLRLFFKDAYHIKGWSKKKLVSAMYRLTLYLEHTEGTMYWLYDYYFLALEGVISEDFFDEVFLDYLNNGTLIEWDYIWSNTVQVKPSFIEKLIDKLGHIFKK